MKHADRPESVPPPSRPFETGADRGSRRENPAPHTRSVPLRLLPRRALLPRLRPPPGLGVRGLRAAGRGLREDRAPSRRLAAGAEDPADAGGRRHGGADGPDRPTARWWRLCPGARRSRNPHRPGPPDDRQHPVDERLRAALLDGLRPDPDPHHPRRRPASLDSVRRPRRARAREQAFDPLLRRRRRRRDRSSPAAPRARAALDLDRRRGGVW